MFKAEAFLQLHWSASPINSARSTAIAVPLSTKAPEKPHLPRPLKIARQNNLSPAPTLRNLIKLAEEFKTNEGTSLSKNSKKRPLEKSDIVKYIKNPTTFIQQWSASSSTSSSNPLNSKRTRTVLSHPLEI